MFTFFGHLPVLFHKIENKEYRYSSGIVANYCRYTNQHGREAAAYKQLQYIIAHHLCNIAHGAKKGIYNVASFFGRILQKRDWRRRWLLGKICRCDIERASTALNNQICWASDSRESNGLNLLKKMRFARKLYKAAHARVELNVEGSVLNSANSLLLDNLHSCNCIFAQQPPQKCIYDTRKDAHI